MNLKIGGILVDYLSSQGVLFAITIPCAAGATARGTITISPADRRSRNSLQALTENA
jgi:hypothetical protein